jgi:hypothetical protein
MSQFRSPFIVTRKEPGTFVNGDWVEGDYIAFVIQASVQPVKGSEMEMLPEGRRNSQAVKIYTSTKLNTVEEANPDLLQAFGSDFEIFSVEPWQSNVINHYKCIGMKVGPQTVPDNARVMPDGSIRVTADDDIRVFND